MRQEFFEPPAPNWLQWAILIWTIPFLWVAVSMSIRRAVNAGQNATLGLCVLIPFLNYFFMALLYFLPQSSAGRWRHRSPPRVDDRMQSAMLGILCGVAISIGMLLLGVYLLRDYGASLFLGTPIVVGASSAFIYNRPYARTLGSSLGVAQLAIFISGLVILLLAFEGLICLVMLFPIASAMGFLGGLIGHVLGASTASHATTLLIMIGVLPMLAGVESIHRPTPLYEVTSSIEIDAPPEVVWPHVAGASNLELTDPPSWYFRLGIAYPTRATIDGEGVGAIRHCEFSTGNFVEPITAWEQPNRLAFDVASQPPPMHELSPYRHVHPPHLDGYLRCQKGEFRLIRLPDNRTRLEGSTWYEFEIYPQDYWTLWSDLCIHLIHQRVLKQIKLSSELSMAN